MALKAITRFVTSRPGRTIPAAPAKAASASRPAPAKPRPAPARAAASGRATAAAPADPKLLERLDALLAEQQRTNALLGVLAKDLQARQQAERAAAQHEGTVQDTMTRTGMGRGGAQAALSFRFPRRSA